MEKIASFTIDHIKLQPGVYVSRKDKVGDSTVTTFDLRMTSPNEEPVMNTAEMHTIEHLGATFLRNHKDFGDKTVYFGPMVDMIQGITCTGHKIELLIRPVSDHICHVIMNLRITLSCNCDHPF